LAAASAGLVFCLLSLPRDNHMGGFAINFQNEILHRYAARHTFDNTMEQNARAISDGVVVLAAINNMDNTARVELLSGGAFEHENFPGDEPHRNRASARPAWRCTCDIGGARASD